MITRNRTRIIAALASATMKDFHNAGERELLAKLYEMMERNNENEKADKPVEKTPAKRTRKPKALKGEPGKGLVAVSSEKSGDEEAIEDL